MLHKHQNRLIDLLKFHDLEGIKGLAIPTERLQNHSLSWRSALMLSTHNLKHLLKIPTINAECIMLNLEDGVSAEQKPYALVLCALALSSNTQCDKKLIVRVNPLDEGGCEEIAYLNPFKPDGIRIPKIRTVADVERALELIDENIEVHLSIETKEAWLGLSSLAIHPRIKAYYLGILDLFADLGLSHSLLLPDNPALQYILSHFLITSRACGVKAVSFVYQDYKNSEGLRHWLELEKMIGFDAKGCISPDQVELIHDIFGHTISEIERCYEIIRLFEEHAALGMSGFSDERFGFIDEPIYKGALAVVKTLV
ncbi:MAG: aldolase/citrate lyase family protein [Sulfuricurvum sp.]|uniref:HpcH/HpaI aldolase/citrate lyase family protein n=1 Tax=Sulfuricurvum sp. TaxID=2025608 RepID=UPI00261423C9|nr:aldolase/citrate lyase family protein [Sulfuricurvum sp.]MDD2829607.1 aldolase/citrate lyase family protein [Sulfuricurvum sp.]MDD4950539.1 aldolase/citrate lyase family protein [Sulfuricurvum sp.]